MDFTISPTGLIYWIFSFYTYFSVTEMNIKAQTLKLVTHVKINLINLFNKRGTLIMYTYKTMSKIL